MSTPTKTPPKKSSLPFCARCGEHIGTAAFPPYCGACKRLMDKKPVALQLSDWRRFAELVKRHWGSGRVRDLLFAPNGYRPSLLVRVSMKSLDSAANSPAALAEETECEERYELADLYDRAQCSRHDSRRACRS